MPVPGPRTQFAPDPGYRNPDSESPIKFNLWLRPGPVRQVGRTPGTMIATLRGCILGAGQIRRMWRQSINYIPAQPPYSWTGNGPGPDRPGMTPPPFMVTRALRYMTRSVYMGAGIDNSRFAGLHTAFPPRGQRSLESRGFRVTAAAGSVRGRPTVRNRLTSFGSRVPPINKPVDAAGTTT